MATLRAYLHYLSLAGIFLLFSCSETENKVDADSLRKEKFHYFSNTESQDRFILQFVCPHCEANSLEYTNSDILSGNLMLSIYSSDNKNLYTHQWSVSNCFSMADNHYMSEVQKVEKFLSIVEHFFDSAKFSSMKDLKITGILRSADLPLRKDIEADPNNVGFSFIQEDFCVMYSRTFQQAVLLRALRKDLLRKYGIPS